MTRKWPAGVAAWVFSLGLYCTIAGAVAAKNWVAFAAGTRIYYGVSLLAGGIPANGGAGTGEGHGGKSRGGGQSQSADFNLLGAA